MKVPVKTLVMDTSTEVVSLAVTTAEQVFTQTLPGAAQSSASLIPGCLQLLGQAGLRLQDLDGLVFGRGPGSFTGLRTACAVTQGFAFAVDKPVLPVDTLLAVAEQTRLDVQGAQAPSPLTVLALLDARMNEMYMALYRWAPQTGWQTLMPLQVAAQLPDSSAWPADTIVSGNAVQVYPDRMPAGLRTHVALPTAQAMASLAPALWAAGQGVSAELAMPLYIRDKVAQTTAEREAVKAAQFGAAA
ncbi:MAG: tRNA threonylcarbamoyladenosine biosynthesis protein TsaB [Pseudomonadota bacterium]|jgi:tRNA threonylcarbamoyladenosine biosynthesis protein TsaB